MDSIQISQLTIDAIKAHARRDAPNECCGLLVGQPGVVTGAVATRNAASERRTRYQIDPRDHFEAIRSARDRGLEIIGAYHSHPRGSAVPSETDLAEAFNDFVFIIAGLGSEPVEVTAWTWSKGNFVRLTLVDTSEGPQKEKVESKK